MKLERILKLAETISLDEFNKLSSYFDGMIKKISKYVPENDGSTPNPWKSNMDYGLEGGAKEREQSPYYGNVADFLKKFPGGIKEWREWRDKSKKKRWTEYNNLPEKTANIDFSDMSDIPETVEDEYRRKEFLQALAELEKLNLTPEEIEILIKSLKEKKSLAHFAPMSGPGDYDFSKEKKNLPWSGKMSEFMNKFPGGLKEWKEKRQKLKEYAFNIKDGVIETKNEIISIKASKEPFTGNIQKQTVENENFRNVIYTGANEQLVLMTLKPGEEIGEEVHNDVDQFFRIEEGMAKFILNGENYFIEEEGAALVPAGVKHNVINESDSSLKLYTIYSPPHHEDGTIHKTKEEADAAEAEHMGKHAHYIPEGGDDVDKFKNEPHLYSGDDISKYKDIRDFIDKRRKHMEQGAVDAAYDAAQDFVNYYKLLLKGRKRRKK